MLSNLEAVRILPSGQCFRTNGLRCCGCGSRTLVKLFRCLDGTSIEIIFENGSKNIETSCQINRRVSALVGPGRSLELDLFDIFGRKWASSVDVGTHLGSQMAPKSYFGCLRQYTRSGPRKIMCLAMERVHMVICSGFAGSVA